jgi:hypothetical protein
LERGLFDALFLANSPPTTPSRGSYSPSEFAAYGQDMPDRSTSYERIEEYVELCCRLWDSWQPDAIVADRETGIYAHPEKIAEVRFDGKYFRCRARHFVAPSPQGRPVCGRAGVEEVVADCLDVHRTARRQSDQILRCQRIQRQLLVRSIVGDTDPRPTGELI